MKKTILVILAFSMILCICGCSVIKEVFVFEKKNVHVEDIQVSGEMQVDIGSTTTLVAKTFPEDALTTIEWTSEDTAIATVDQNGVVTGHSAGECHVTAAASNGVKKSIVITVVDVALTAEQIYQQCSPSVFYIEVYKANGTTKGSGSGFFIDSNGTAVTNFHVIDGCASAKITTSDTKETYNVLGVYHYSIEEDWAVIKVDGTGFVPLEIEKNTVVGGATVFAIGSPLGLQNTISQGLISNPQRQERGMNYIQTTAAISSGSSGGALLNEFGKVIGITSASYIDGQNLNLAVPLSYVNTSTSGSLKKLSVIEKSVSIEDPVQFLKDFLLRYGIADALTGGNKTLVTYSLEMKDTSGVTYLLSYTPNTGYMYIEKDYTTQFSDISTLLYFSGAGTNEVAAKAVFNYFDTYSGKINRGFAFVFRESVTNATTFEFYSWLGEGSISQDAAETICYRNMLDIIDMADYIFAYYNLPLTMVDFGYVY